MATPKRCDISPINNEGVGRKKRKIKDNKQTLFFLKSWQILSDTVKVYMNLA